MPQKSKKIWKLNLLADDSNSTCLNSVAIDLELLYGDLSVVSKGINDEPIQQLFLHENFNSIIVLEGEAGSGKIALLRKILFFFWISGCCPILSRFKFVFYLSLTYARSYQIMADTICNQPIGFVGPLTGTTLRDVVQPLKNVLFLLDDYSEINSVPQIDHLKQRNHLYQHCLVFAVLVSRTREIHKYPTTTLSTVGFPLSSTLYVPKKLFFYDIDLVQQLLFQVFEKSMQTILKTPLFMLFIVLTAYWVQHPKGNIISDKAIFKAYLLYHLLKCSEERQHVLATISDVKLALTGLFKPSFDFTEYDLSEAGVDGDGAVRLGLLTKFTAQTLHRVSKFFQPLFQKFLAGRRLTELLVYDKKEKEQGLLYLQQIKIFRKAAGRRNFLLVYICSFSSKAVPQIISCLFIIDCKESLESKSEKLHLQHHSDLPINMFFIDQLSFINPKLLLPVFIQYLLDFATSVVFENNTVSVCDPIIFHFLRGKYILLSSFLSPQKSKLHFFQVLSLPSSFQVAVQGSEHRQEFHISEIGACCSSLEMPTINQDYTPTFTLFNMAQKLKEEKNINIFFFFHRRHLPDSIVCSLLPVTGKMLLLKCMFSNISSLPEADLRNITLFSVSVYIELQLNNSPGFIEVIKQYKEHFNKCSLHHLSFSITEELPLLMSFVERLEEDEKEIPELLFSNLDKLICLEELSVNQRETCNVFDTIPDGFKNLCNVEKSLVSRMKLENISRLAKVRFETLVEFTESFQDLSVFHLDCSNYFSSESLLAAISSRKKLPEIKLTESCLKDLLSLAAALSNFVSLKVLDLKSQYFDHKEALVLHNLGVLNQEELILPAGKGIKSTAKLIVQQYLHLLHLRWSSFILCLDDDSVVETGKVANYGGSQKLEKVSQLVNQVTETGRNVFRTPNMPALELDVSCMVTHQIKASAPTVMTFVQCFPSVCLVPTVMVSWLLHAEDLKGFDIMKDHHPQSRRLKLSWQWLLSLSSIFENQESLKVFQFGL
ncbi:LOW QUALITY PROTEIN: baculoviral IAP repeat-containing protein 1 [Leptosomus discolor]